MDEEEASAVHDAVQSRIGTALHGKYLLEQLLGVGGMAAVYRATNTTVRRPCAVKVLHQEISGIRDLRERFLREGRVANAVGHPGAVDILDCDVTTDGAAFLVMELLDGRCVDALRDKNRRLGLSAVLAIAHELLGVLVAAHAKGVVHRDLKPANLFMTREGRLKVLDFGIARIRDTGSGFDVTRSGVSMGTPAFMAPEQALGKTDEVGPRSDLWSVGATMFSLLTGRNVHVAETAQEMMVLVATTPVVSLGAVAPEIPAPVVALVDRALAFDKSARWPDADSMRAAVAAATIATSGDASTQGIVASSPSAAPALESTLIAVASEAPPVSAMASAPSPAPPAPAATGPGGTRRAGVGSTTLQPISSAPVVPMARMASSPLVIGVVLAALVVVGVAIWLTVRRGTQAVGASPLVSTTTSVATSAVTAPTASATGEPPTHASAAVAPSSAPTASAAAVAPARAMRRTPPIKPPDSVPPLPPRPPPSRDPLAP